VGEEIEVALPRDSGNSSLTPARLALCQLANQRPIFGPLQERTKHQPITVVSVAAIHVHRADIANLAINKARIAGLSYRRATYAQLPVYYAQTAYKRVADKVRPVNIDELSGENPGGAANWEETAIEKEKQYGVNDSTEWDGWIHPKVSLIERGVRLTPERLKLLRVGMDLTPQERSLLETMLSNREAALSWEFNEIGRLNPDVAPPQKIRTIPHEPWRVPNFNVPRALLGEALAILKIRMDRGILELCHGSYRNPWFLVKKKNGEYRLINAATKLNGVTIKDACIPPNVEEFVEEMSGLAVASVLDMFSGYDQIELDKSSRNMTGFSTPLGLLRMTTLPQGATNSVGQFIRIVLKVLYQILGIDAMPFMDDIAVKGPRSRYDDEEILPGVRRFIMEHIQSLDRTLLKLERAGLTISGEKMQLCVDSMELVGYVCDSDGRHPNKSKVSKILAWGPCEDTKGVRAFLGVIGYFRVFIFDHAVRAAPLYRLLRRDAPFRWDETEQASMDILKEALANAASLVSINYMINPATGEIDEIIVLIDASGEGWGGCICQVLDGKRRPVRFESGLWSEMQKTYDSGKLECLGLLLMLRKSRLWLYGVPFTVESDANTLIAQLNGSITSLPNAMLTRWIAYIRLFDFSLRHVPGRVHSAADGLSRRGLQSADDEPDITPDIEDIIEAGICRVFGIAEPKKPFVRASNATGRILLDEFNNESETIARYLTSLKRPEGMSRSAFRDFRRRATRFLVQDGILYRRAVKGTPLRRVVDQPERKVELVRQFHDNTLCHRGREATYHIVADKFWWDSMFSEISQYVRTCSECQFRQGLRLHEPMRPTWTNMMFETCGLDVVHMPRRSGKRYLVCLRDNFSGWLEVRALVDANAKAMARFIWQEVITRHGCPRRIYVDGGPENKREVVTLLARYGIHRIEITAYNSQAAGAIEVGHKVIKDALAKLEAAGRGPWTENLHAVVLADRITTRQSTGMSPFEMLYSTQAVTPIDRDFPSWATHDWSRVRTTEDLLAYRAIQLLRREEDLQEAAFRLERHRKEGKEWFDERHNIRGTPLKHGDLVLIFNNAKQLDRSTQTRAQPRWTGPFRIHKANEDKGTYTLEELDGTAITKQVAGQRLKKFYAREEQPLEPVLLDPLEPVSPPSPPRDNEEGRNAPNANAVEETEEESQPLFDAVNLADDPEEYEVDAILSHRRFRGRSENREPIWTTKYEVKWTGYDETTFELEENLMGALPTLHEYQQRNGMELTVPARHLINGE
jgi:Integrase zinc binding domain/RNase H-like domain found in reverse transcriptase/Reverse transcriptase (RNA-dependent DNA polymerase)/Chromo (CHRromatin Organisation MOdifier) domain